MSHRLPRFIRQMSVWALIILLQAIFTSSFVNAAALSSRSDTMSRQTVSALSNHEMRFVTPSGVVSPGQTVTIALPSGFDVSAMAFSDIALFHGASTGLETQATIAATAGVGVWGAGVSGQTITLTAPTNANASTITAGQKVVIRFGTNAGGLNRITNPSGAAEYVISVGGTFGDSGGFTVAITSNDTIAVTATVLAQPNGQNGGGGGGNPPPQQPPQQPPQATTTLQITNVQTANITPQTTDVTWNTNLASKSRVDYGKDVQYADGGVQDAALVINHTMHVIGLTPATVYHFQVSSDDGNGHAATSTDQTVQTAPLPPQPPIVSNIHVFNITDTAAVVTWVTDVDADSAVAYGVSSNYGTTSSVVGLMKNHSVPISHLKSDTTYHFRITSADQTGLADSSVDQTFKTLPDITPPANAFGFSATAGDTQIKLNWTNPPDADFARVVIVARTDRLPKTINDGRKVYQGNGTTVWDTGLTNGVTYFYTNFAQDASGNTASGAFAQAAPVGPVPQLEPEPQPQPQPQPTPQPAPQPQLGPQQPIPAPSNGQNEGGGAQGGGPTGPEISTSISGSGQTMTISVPTTTTVHVVLHPQFRLVASNIALEPDYDGSVSLPAAQSMEIRIPMVGWRVGSETSVLAVGNSVYDLSVGPSGEVLSAIFVPAFVPSNALAKIIIHFADGSVAVQDQSFSVLSAGMVLETGIKSSVLVPVPEATVTVYQFSGFARTVWDGSPTQQLNPALTNENGVYFFIVPNGSYRVYAEKAGYRKNSTDITVTNHLLTANVVLERELPPLKDILQSNLPPTTKVAIFAEKAQEGVQVVIDKIRTPQTEAVSQKILVPTVATVSVAGVATATSAFNLLNYLRFLLTQPFLWLKRRKREKFGVVYDSLLKKPIDLAIVRLVDLARNVVVQTHITNVNGQFSFFVKPGKYRMEVVKPGYVFPTQFLKDDKTDVDFLDLYHAEMIEVTKEATLAPNIPIDATEPAPEPKTLIWKRRFRQMQGVAGLGSVGLMCAVLVIVPTPVNAIILFVQTVFYLISRKFTLASKPKDWGIVYDTVVHLPLERAIVRIFHRKFNKLLETQVTDKNGKYGFFASKGVFYVTAERLGYEKYQSSDMDLLQKQGLVIDQSIPMKLSAV